jgi:hypothetical protein
MPKFETFGDFVRLTFKTQAKAAKALKTRQNVISNWVTGRNNPEPEMQEALKDKWGYDGEWPAGKAKEAPAGAGGPYVTVADFAEWRGYWRGGMEALLKRVDDLEDQVRKLHQREASA